MPFPWLYLPAAQHQRCWTVSFTIMSLYRVSTKPPVGYDVRTVLAQVSVCLVLNSCTGHCMIMESSCVQPLTKQVPGCQTWWVLKMPRGLLKKTDTVFTSPLVGKALLLPRCHIIEQRWWMDGVMDKEALNRKWGTLSQTFHFSPFVLNEFVPTSKWTRI